MNIYLDSCTYVVVSAAASIRLNNFTETVNKRQVRTGKVPVEYSVTCVTAKNDEVGDEDIDTQTSIDYSSADWFVIHMVDSAIYITADWVTNVLRMLLNIQRF